MASDLFLYISCEIPVEREAISCEFQLNQFSDWFQSVCFKVFFKSLGIISSCWKPLVKLTMVNETTAKKIPESGHALGFFLCGVITELLLKTGMH